MRLMRSSTCSVSSAVFHSPALFFLAMPWYYYKCTLFAYLAPPSLNVKIVAAVISIDSQFESLSIHSSGMTKRRKLEVVLLI